ncbi:MAG: cell division protein BolA [Candidatus Thiodiazotropha sp.]|jgi:hypothetical protein
MSVCKSLKGYTRKHERLAVALFFGSLYLVLAFHSPIVSWLEINAVFRIPMLVGLLLLDIFMISMCLNIGAARFADEDESCFHTFKGRRAGSGSIGIMFSNWLHHMEQVGRKHR